MPKCADKYSAREYISSYGYEDYLPKLYWHGVDPELIPFDSLPDSFVIKSTSGSGNNIIVKDNNFDRNNVIAKCKSWLKEKYLIAYGEWHYEHIPPSIIVEEFLDDKVNPVPIDYKFFCFNGLEGKTWNGGCIAVDVDRFSGNKRLVFDSDWNFLKEVRFAFSNDYKSTEEKPTQFEQMVKAANVLSKPFPHARVDFFVIGEKFHIGEITFFNGAGFDLVTPYKYNRQMGDWIVLPNEPSRSGGLMK